MSKRFCVFLVGRFEVWKTTGKRPAPKKGPVTTVTVWILWCFPKGAIRIASETFMDQPDGSARPFLGKRFKDHFLEHFLL